MALPSLFNINPPQLLREGNDSIGTIWRSNDMSQAETLEVFVQDVTAQGGFDYDPQVQTITFAPGQVQAFYNARAFADSTAEGQETYQVFLRRAGDTNSNGYLAMTTVTIMDGISRSEAAATSPVFTPTVTPQVPGNNVSGNTVNSGNSNSYNTTNVTNNYYTDNSQNYNNSFNTDNSVTNNNLSYVLNANDYSTGKTINGSGQLSGTAANDLITGGSKADSLFGDLGNDKLIGGKGRDGLYGGFGSNVFNAGFSRSRTDADRLYIQREGTAATADIIESIGRSDRVYLQGSTSNLSVRGVDGGLGIFDNGILQAIYTGNTLNASQLTGQVFAA